MSIIRDALKKAQEKSDMEQGRSVVGSDEKAPPRKTSGLLISLALVVGVTALGVVGWRVVGVLKAKKDQAPQIVSSTPVQGVATVSPSPPRMVPLTRPETDRGDGLTRQAERLFWLGDLAGSEKVFQEAIAADTGDSAELANNLGLVLRKQGKLKEAVRLFDKALKENPGMVEALNNRAVAYRRMKRYKEAAADLEKALKAQPGYGHALFNLGTVHEAMGKTGEAIRYYKQYLDNSSRTPGLDETLIRQRITALEAEGSSAVWPAGQGRKGR